MSYVEKYCKKKKSCQINSSPPYLVFLSTATGGTQRAISTNDRANPPVTPHPVIRPPQTAHNRPTPPPPTLLHVHKRLRGVEPEYPSGSTLAVPQHDRDAAVQRRGGVQLVLEHVQGVQPVRLGEVVRQWRGWRGFFFVPALGRRGRSGGGLEGHRGGVLGDAVDVVGPCEQAMLGWFRFAVGV